MLKIGITGGIGSGKSVVSAVVKTMGYPVFNSDEQSKRLTVEHPEIRKELIALVGEEVYSDSELNREFLAGKIFSDDAIRKQVNEIIHPRVREAFEIFCAESGAALVFNEAAILIETGSYQNFDKIILVTAPEELRIQRVMKRDHASYDEVKARLSKQWTDEQKIPYGDFVLVNDDRTPLLNQIEAVIVELSA